jgi:hypothetical protein
MFLLDVSKKLRVQGELDYAEPRSGSLNPAMDNNPEANTGLITDPWAGRLEGVTRGLW